MTSISKEREFTAILLSLFTWLDANDKDTNKEN